MTDVLVIGAGLSGLTAAVHAVRAGASVRLIANGWGRQVVAPGWISVWDRANGDPLAEAAEFAATAPAHPYALVSVENLRAALAAFEEITGMIGLPYKHAPGRNLRLPTLLGAIQTPLMAPRGVAQGDLTGLDGELLIVGFTGWRDFYPDPLAGNLARQGIQARAVWVNAPVTPGAWDQWPGDLARALDDESTRAAVIEQVFPHVKDAARIGFPAVLGWQNPAAVLDHMADALQRPVFEIPTLPPSNAGTQLGNRLRRWLLRQRARVQIGHPVVKAIVEGSRCLGVEVGALGHTNSFFADHVILATGGLYNGGIVSDETGHLWEPIFGLPVQAPPGEERTGWYAERLLDPNGHPIHRDVGVCVDAALRPPQLENVRVVGHLLAGFNPLTGGCAEGVDLATAYHAVQNILGSNHA